MAYIAPEIFRAYDIRGIVDDTLTELSVYKIGQAIGHKVINSNDHKIIVGRDGRLSGERLQNQLMAGLLSVGCEIVDIGQVTTPIVYFATYDLAISHAVMLTGSHNPINYNGIKIILNGSAIYGDAIQELYRIIQNNIYNVAGFNFDNFNKIIKKQMIPSYIDYICNNISLPKRPKGRGHLKVVVDCGNGVAGLVAPYVYKALGCEVINLHCEVDGNFPNHHPDPGDPRNLQDLIIALKKYQVDIGFAFDGDGDRLGIVDNTGKIIWPDRVLMLLAQDVLYRNPGSTIIFDVKSSGKLTNVINNAKGVPLMWKTGHSLIKAKMQETGALLAGEMSGHIFFKERWFGFDDAIYAGARLLELLAKQELPASAIFASLPEYMSTPEIAINVSEREKFAIIEKLIEIADFKDAIKISTIDGLRVDFSSGWGLIRASNTTPTLVARFEGVDIATLQNIQADFKKLLLSAFPQLAIPF